MGGCVASNSTCDSALIRGQETRTFFLYSDTRTYCIYLLFLLHERGIDGSLVRSVVASMVVPNSSNVRPMASWKTKACYDRLCTFSTVLLMADGVNQLMNSLTYIISVSFAIWFEQHLRQAELERPILVIKCMHERRRVRQSKILRNSMCFLV